MSTIAAHLVTGHGFINPYVDPALHMQTTVCPPLYVWIIAGVYKVFGIETYASRVLLQSFNIVVHCATMLVLYSFWARATSTHHARWFAMLYSLHPLLIYMPFNVWETSLTTLFLSILLYFATYRLAAASSAELAIFGVLLGVTSLSNPAWTIGYPFLCLIPMIRNRRPGTPYGLVKPLAIVFATFALVVTPWIVRNYQATGAFVFIRGMTAAELLKGNNPDANGGHGTGFVEYHLLANEEERKQLARLGEREYDREKRKEALGYVTSNPARYLRLTAQRIVMWWSGDIDAAVWYSQRSSHYSMIAWVLVLSGLITSIAGFRGLYLLRARLRDLWALLIYVFYLPLPYLLIIVGFRYQSALMPFLLLPASYAIAHRYGKTRPA